jgi:hypothetical protein
MRDFAATHFPSNKKVVGACGMAGQSPAGRSLVYSFTFTGQACKAHSKRELKPFQNRAESSQQPAASSQQPAVSQNWPIVWSHTGS